jgi:hypothetical protein
MERQSDNPMLPQSRDAIDMREFRLRPIRRNPGQNRIGHASISREFRIRMTALVPRSGDAVGGHLRPDRGRAAK